MENILIIEDEPDVGKNIAEILETAGYGILEARNGDEALRITGKTVPDMIISDIMMPGRDGYSVLEEMQKSDPLSQIPFIFLTAKTDYAEMRKGMRKGADDYIVKPFKADDLLETVKTRFAKKRRISEKLNRITEGVFKYVPHELRTPMVALLGYSDLLLTNIEDFSPVDISSAAERINVSARRLNRTIGKFIFLSELNLISQTGGDPSCGEVNRHTSERIKDIAAETAGRFSRNADTVFNLTEGSIRITDYHLEVLIKELADNAFKYSPPSTAVCFNTYIEERIFVIEVINCAAGISESYKSEVRSSIKQKAVSYNNNTGMGLFIADKISELYGGNMIVECGKDELFKMKILLPLYIKSNVHQSNLSETEKHYEQR